MPPTPIAVRPSGRPAECSCLRIIQLFRATRPSFSTSAIFFRGANSDSRSLHPRSTLSVIPRWSASRTQPSFGPETTLRRLKTSAKAYTCTSVSQTGRGSSPTTSGTAINLCLLKAMTGRCRSVSPRAASAGYPPCGGRDDRSTSPSRFDASAAHPRRAGSNPVPRRRHTSGCSSDGLQSCGAPDQRAGGVSAWVDPEHQLLFAETAWQFFWCSTPAASPQRLSEMASAIR